MKKLLVLAFILFSTYSTGATLRPKVGDTLWTSVFIASIDVEGWGKDKKVIIGKLESEECRPLMIKSLFQSQLEIERMKSFVKKVWRIKKTKHYMIIEEETSKKILLYGLSKFRGWHKTKKLFVNNYDLKGVVITKNKKTCLRDASNMEIEIKRDMLYIKK